MESDGSDFFSPSLEVADLIKRVLSQKDFIPWCDAYFTTEGIKRICELPKISDHNAYQIIHIDGLAFTRAWCMKEIANALPQKHPYKKLFVKTAKQNLSQTLSKIFKGGYGGEHWLASFAGYAFCVK